MSKQDYKCLLSGFQELAVQVGNRLFDLCWHNLSGIKVSFEFDKHGSWTKVKWPDLAVEDWPFDSAKRLVIGQLCLPLDDTGSTFTLGLDPVTIPRIGAAAELVTVREGFFSRPKCIGHIFRDLSAQAGIALPPVLRDQLVKYCSVINQAPANWWYALLFAMSGQTVGQQDRGIIVDKPLLYSVDVIQRFGLNTDNLSVPTFKDGEDSVKDNEDNVGSWYHQPTESRPDHFYFGPLTGQAKKLNTCFSSKNDKNNRALKEKGRRGKIWIMQRDRYCYEVWFQSQDEYDVAKRKLNAKK